MHRIATTPGGWNPDTEGVIFIEQTPAPIVVLTAADTDIQAIAMAWEGMPIGFPEVRVASLLALQQQLTIDTYAEDILQHAQIIVIRLLGGVSYWPYGLEVVQEIAARSGSTGAGRPQVIVIPGDDRPDPMLLSHSTLPLADVNQVWRYFIEGGVENMQRALYCLANLGLDRGYAVKPPRSVPKVGLYPTNTGSGPRVGLVFYRAHYLAGNTAPIEDLCQALRDRQLSPVPVFVSSLRDPTVQAGLLDYFKPANGSGIGVLLNTTSFSLINPAPLYPAIPTAVDTTDLWQKLDVPVLQVILSGGSEADWQDQARGLSPRDTAMNVALPEVDGRIITRAVSFKAAQNRHPVLQTEVTGYRGIADRVSFVADLAQNWSRLRHQPVAERKVALILANYPNRDGRLANGVGLDTPA
jgi:cobaltochelatase CobN